MALQIAVIIQIQWSPNYGKMQVYTHCKGVFKMLLHVNGLYFFDCRKL